MSFQQILCPHCRRPVGNDGSLAGRLALCPHCRGQFQMPPPTMAPDAQVSGPAPPQASAPPPAAQERSDSQGIAGEFVAERQRQKGSLLGILLLLGVGGLLIGAVVAAAFVIRRARLGDAPAKNVAKTDKHSPSAASSSSTSSPFSTSSPPLRSEDDGGNDSPNAKGAGKTTQVLPEDREALSALEQLGARLKFGKQGELLEADLSAVEFTDEQMHLLAGLANLTTLVLRDAKVTDVGLKHIEKLKRLENLDLQNCSISDGGLAHLRGLTELRLLNLYQTRITDAGLGYLIGLTEMRHLNLGGNQIFDAGLRHLAKLTKLESLALHFTKVSTFGLKHLANLERLQILDLQNTRVGNAGMRHLTGLSRLKRVNVRGMRVDAEGAALLEAERPQVNVLWSSAGFTDEP